MTLRRFDPFEDELGGLPFDDVSSEGTASASLGTITATVSGQVTAFGAAVAPLGTITATAAGVKTVSGVAVAPLGTITATAEGFATSFTPGLATADLGTITATVSGQVTVFGIAVVSISALTATVAAQVTHFGLAVAPLGTITATASGTTNIITAAASLGTINATVVGKRTVLAVAAAPLGTITATVSGIVFPAGTVGGVLTANLGTINATMSGFNISHVVATARAVLRTIIATVEVPVPPVAPPQSGTLYGGTRAIPPTTIGTGEYEVYFKTRGGDTFVCRARNLTSLSFQRVLNEVSTANVTIALSGQDGVCDLCVAGINSWEHEVAIYRNGEEVWCGPVVNAEFDLDGMVAVFECKDLFTWADRRWIEVKDEDYEVEDTELAEVWNWVLSHGYNKDPWNMEWNLGRTGIPLNKTFYPCFQEPDRWGGAYPNVGEELRTLAKSGLDFTVIRRTLIGGDLEINPPGIMPTLQDRHWAKLPRISMVGESMATEMAVAGGGGGYGGFADDQMWIERPDDEYRNRYGLIQRFMVESSLDEEDTTDLPNAITQQAYGLRALKKEPFTYIKGGELSSNAPVDFDTLIPGYIINLSLTQTIRQIQSNYRLTQVDVQYNGTSESIALELTPVGAEALRT